MMYTSRTIQHFLRLLFSNIAEIWCMNTENTRLYQNETQPIALFERNVLRGYCPESRQISNGVEMGTHFYFLRGYYGIKLEIIYRVSHLEV